MSAKYQDILMGIILNVLVIGSIILGYKTNNKDLIQTMWIFFGFIWLFVIPIIATSTDYSN